MPARDRAFAAIADTLLTNIRDMLSSPDPKTRVDGIRHLAVGVDTLERQVLLDAQKSGLSWAQIGEVYGVSRQAAHQRFSDKTVVPSDFLDHLLDDLEEDAEAAPALTRAAERVRRSTRA